MQGRFAESAASAQRAFDADAYLEQRPIVSTAFFTSLHAEQFDDARRWCTFALEHYQGDPRFSECELTLLGWTGRLRSAVAAATQLVTRIEQRDTLGILAPTWEYRRLMVAAILARAGMQDSARAILRTVQQRPATDARTRSSAIPEAYVRILLNDREGALNRLADLMRVAPQVRPMLTKHPWLRALREDPRLVALAKPAP